MQVQRGTDSTHPSSTHAKHRRDLVTWSGHAPSSPAAVLQFVGQPDCPLFCLHTMGQIEFSRLRRCKVKVRWTRLPSVALSFSSFLEPPNPIQGPTRASFPFVLAAQVHVRRLRKETLKWRCTSVAFAPIGQRRFHCCLTVSSPYFSMRRLRRLRRHPPALASEISGKRLLTLQLGARGTRRSSPPEGSGGDESARPSETWGS